jgi:hypothetical protein
MPALDVNARGSLVAWYASLLWTLTAAASFMVYSIRRHRLDDYRGRYRLWLGVAVLCVIASVDLTTGLHTALARELTQLTGTQLYGNESLWWILSAGVVGGLAAIRLIVEMRSCRLAVLALLLTVGAFATAGCVETRLLVLDEGLLLSMLQSSCLLAAHLCMVVAVASYARYVYREAQGELPLRKAKTDKAKSSRAAKSSTEQAKEARAARSVRVDAGHSTVAAKANGVGPTHVVRASDPETADESTESDDASLSRSERRRLRKELRRQAKAG